jgi:serine/threonine protein kinase
MATSRIDGHKYALKVMKHRYANIDKIKKDKEIKGLKSLSHPHIIKLMDVLYDPD